MTPRTPIIKVNPHLPRDFTLVVFLYPENTYMKHTADIKADAHGIVIYQEDDAYCPRDLALTYDGMARLRLRPGMPERDLIIPIPPAILALLLVLPADPQHVLKIEMEEEPEHRAPGTPWVLVTFSWGRDARNDITWIPEISDPSTAATFLNAEPTIRRIVFDDAQVLSRSGEVTSLADYIACLVEALSCRPAGTSTPPTSASD